VGPCEQALVSALLNETSLELRSAEQLNTARHVSVDTARRVLSPSQIESGELREVPLRRIGQMVMDPPCEVLPVAAALILVREPRDYDTSTGAHAALGIAAIPDVMGVVRVILSAALRLGDRRAVMVQLERPE